ncbi:hypothetical protein ACFSTC_10810 [Nonomuraea ferruginea]
MGAREEILGRIRQAVRGAPEVEIPRGYRTAPPVDDLARPVRRAGARLPRHRARAARRRGARRDHRAGTGAPHGDPRRTPARMVGGAPSPPAGRWPNWTPPTAS